MNEKIQSNELEFLHKLWAKIDQTIIHLEMIENDPKPWDYRSIICAETLMVQIYTGIEDTLRLFLEKVKGIELNKSEKWHEDLLQFGLNNNIISKNNHEMLKKYLDFYLFVNNSFQFNLDADKLYLAIPKAIGVFLSFIKDLQDMYGIDFEFHCTRAVENKGNESSSAILRNANFY